MGLQRIEKKEDTRQQKFPSFSACAPGNRSARLMEGCREPFGSQPGEKKFRKQLPNAAGIAKLTDGNRK
jgi:hypothetical protein